MDDHAKGFMEGMRDCFNDLPDPRVVGRCDHRLLDIIAIVILAVASGADEWTEIELFGDMRKEWLKDFLELPEGIPSHDTFRRVFGQMNRKQFAACLLKWTRALAETMKGKLVGIDGKTLRRSHRRKANLSALHLVTAWCSDNGLTLAQVAVEDKSNEITAIPELLKLFKVKGCTVTIDAMGCQKEIVDDIREAKAHYVLAAKENQPHLYEDLVTHFDVVIDNAESLPPAQQYSTHEAHHGRKEDRFYYSTPIPEALRHRDDWRDIASVGCVISNTERDGKEGGMVRYFISDHKPNAKRLANAVRKHWSTENSQHWVLDIAFREDDRRQQDRNGAANLAAVRRLAVSLFRRDKETKQGAKAKRLKAALDPRYLLNVLQYSTFGA
jgi:predicted transposase YbfD/YdcC